MNISRPLLLAAAIGAVIAGGAIVKMCDSAESLDDYLQSNGFVRVYPPSQLYGPGTFNTVEIREDGSLFLYSTCSLDDDAEKSRLERMLISESVDHRITIHDGANFAARMYRQLAEMAKTGIGGKAGFSQNIDVELSHVRVVAMPYDALLEFEEVLLRGSCERAIIVNLQAGAMVCQTQAVLQADLEHAESTNQNATVDALAGLKPQAGEVSLNAEASHKKTLLTSGKDQFLGVKLRDYERGCIRLPQTASATM